MDVYERGGMAGGEGAEEGAGEGVAGGKRPSLRVFYECSGAYLRVLREVDGRGYLARCPKCGKGTRFVVGEGGTGERDFRIDCRGW